MATRGLAASEAVDAGVDEGFDVVAGHTMVWRTAIQPCLHDAIDAEPLQGQISMAPCDHPLRR